MRFDKEARKRIKLDTLSGIDGDLIQKYTEERIRLLERMQKRRSRSPYSAIIRIGSVAASVAIVFAIVAVILLAGGKTVPIYEGMSVSSVMPIYPPSQAGLPDTLPALDVRRGALTRMGLVNWWRSTLLNTTDPTASVTDEVTEESAENTQTESDSLPGDLSPSVSEVFYTNPNEDFYITVHFKNPDAFEILSFTINETKYTSYMFEPGSDLEHIILKCNLGDVPPGVYEYTIDAIKYVDGTEIKDVVIGGDRTVRISARQTDEPSVEDVTVTQSLGVISVAATLTDRAKALEATDGYVEIQLYQGETLVSTERFSPTDAIRADFAVLPSLGYTVKAVLFYDGFDEEGFIGHISHSETLVARAPFTVTVANAYAMEAQIVLEWDESVPEADRTIVRIEGASVRAFDGHNVRFTLEGLACDTVNRFSICYMYDGVERVNQYEVKTVPVTVPTFTASVENVGLTSLTFRLEVNDPTRVIKSIDIGSISPAENIRDSFTEEITGLEPLSEYVFDINMRYYTGNDNRTELLNEVIYAYTQSPGLEVMDNKVVGIGTCTDTELYIFHSVADGAFKDNTNITAVHFGSTYSIGDDAFSGCTSLSTIDLSRVSSIGKNAFANCKGGGTLTVPDDVSDVGLNAFKGTPFELVIVNGGFIYDRDDNWSYCFRDSGMTVAAYEKPVSGEDVVYVPHVVGCESVETLENGLIIATRKNGERVVVGLENLSGHPNLTGITTVVPEGVVEVSDHVQYLNFKENGLGTIALPESLRRIGEMAFYDRSLDAITIPSGVEYVGENAFGGGSTNLAQRIYVCASGIPSTWDTDWYEGGYNQYSESSKDIYVGFSRLETGSDGSEYIILNNGDKILTSYAGPAPAAEVIEGVVEIAPYAFENYKSRITTVKLPSTLKALRAYAFYGCTKIVTFDLPSGLTYIGTKALSGCRPAEVYIPRTVEIIEADAVRSTVIYCEREKAPATWASNWYRTQPEGTSIKWAYNSSPDITDANGYVYHYEGTVAVLTDYVGGTPDIVIPEGIQVIADGAMPNVKYVSSITLPGTLQRIGINFMNDLTEAPNQIFIPSNVTELGNGTLASINYILFEASEHSFRKAYGQTLIFNAEPVIYDGQGGEYFLWDGELCLSEFTGVGAEYTVRSETTKVLNRAFALIKSLKKVILPDNEITIGDGAFVGCTALEEVVGGRIISVGTDAFNGCEKLKYAAVSEHTESIADGAFRLCRSIQSISLVNIESLGVNCFADCEALTAAFINGTLTSIPDSCFDGCASLAEVVIPDSVTEIGDYAFRGCVALTKAPMPDSLSSIGKSAFYGCKLIGNLTFPKYFASIGSSAFEGCHAIKEITLNEGITTIGDNAFRNTSVKRLILPKTVYFFGDGVVDDDCMLFFEDDMFPVSFDESAYYSVPDSTRGVLPILSFKGFETVDGVEYAIGRTTNDAFSDQVRIVIGFGTTVGHVTVAEGAAYIFPCATRKASVSSGFFESLTLPGTLKEICAHTKIRVSAIIIPKSVTTVGVFAFAESSTLLVFESDTLPAGYATEGLPGASTCIFSFGGFEEEGTQTYVIGRRQSDPIGTQSRFLYPIPKDK